MAVRRSLSLHFVAFTVTFEEPLIVDYRKTLAEQFRKNGHPVIADAIEAGRMSMVDEIAAMKAAHVAGIDACLKICGELDTLGRAEADMRDYRHHVSGEI